MLRWLISKLRMVKIPKMIDIDSKHNFDAKNKVDAENNVDAEDAEGDDDCNNGSASSRLPREIGHPSIPM